MRRPKWSIFIGTLAGLGLMLLAVSRLDWGRCLSALRAAGWFPWLPAAVACYLAGQVVRGLRCRALVSREATLSVPTATNIVVLGYALNNVLPARLGEFARAGMLAERSGLPIVQALTVTVLERVLDVLALLLLFACVGLLSLTQSWMVALAKGAAVLFALAAGVLLGIVLCPGVFLTGVSRLTHRISPRLHDPALRAAGLVVNGVAYLRRPGAALHVVLLSVVVWLIEGGMFLALLPALGLPANPGVAVLAMAVTNLGLLLPSSPGHIGPFHQVCARVLVSRGVAPDVGLAYASLVHLAFFLPITAWGVGVLFSYGLALSRTMALRKQAHPPHALPDLIGPRGRLLRRVQVVQEAPRAPRFYYALVEAFLPPGGPAAESEREAAVEFAAAFVHGQATELPPRLQAMLWLGMLGFRIITRIVYWRSFCALPIEKRRRWVERWAFGPVPLARQLFRMPRSTALLAYYEIPAFAPRPD